MRTKFSKLLLISILSILYAYSNASEIDCGNEVATISFEGATLCVDPWPILSFKETYLRDCQKDEVFFIKGLADDIYEYGRTIEVIEDLKGNFDGEASIFIWGSGCSSQGGGCIIGDRFDNMLQYNDNDTLILLVGKAHKRFVEDIETSCHYTTMIAGNSVLKLLNGYVTGHINYWIGEETVLWEELLALLTTNIIQSTYTKNNIYQQNGTIFFENPEKQIVKLSFYDLSGKLVHEAITTSNSYRPVLTGNMFVCKINININDELYTIKYIVP